MSFYSAYTAIWNTTVAVSTALTGSSVKVDPPSVELDDRNPEKEFESVEFSGPATCKTVDALLESFKSLGVIAERNGDCTEYVVVRADPTTYIPEGFAEGEALRCMTYVSTGKDTYSRFRYPETGMFVEVHA